MRFLQTNPGANLHLKFSCGIAVHCPQNTCEDARTNRKGKKGHFRTCHLNITSSLKLATIMLILSQVPASLVMLFSQVLYLMTPSPNPPPPPRIFSKECSGGHVMSSWTRRLLTLPKSSEAVHLKFRLVQKHMSDTCISLLVLQERYAQTL